MKLNCAIALNQNQEMLREVYLPHKRSLGEVVSAKHEPEGVPFCQTRRRRVAFATGLSSAPKARNPHKMPTSGFYVEWLRSKMLV